MTETAMPGVDSHAHVFTRALKLAAGRRYAPDYDAPIAEYLAMLDRNGMARGVLVQPSFLGTDNSYLLQALAAAPTRLRGVAVVEIEASAAELRELAGHGVVGVRWNLLGRPAPEAASPAVLRQLALLRELGWHLEIQAEAHRWPGLLAPLLESGVSLVADHYGLPDPVRGVDDPGFRALCAAGATGRVWVKLSAPYRSGEAIARAALPRLKAAFGTGRLLWGSDWPHTRFERVATPEAGRRFLEALLPDPREHEAVFATAPARLFGFPPV